MEMTDDNTQRIIGEHTADIETLKTDMGEIKADVKSILAIINQGKGSWKTLIGVASASSTVGAIIASLWPFHK